MNEEKNQNNDFSLLTTEEWYVYNKLSEAWNAFIDLPVFIPNDNTDFAFHVNAAKSILMSRPVMRELSDRLKDPLWFEKWKESQSKLTLSKRDVRDETDL